MWEPKEKRGGDFESIPGGRDVREGFLRTGKDGKVLKGKGGGRDPWWRELASLRVRGKSGLGAHGDLEKISEFRSWSVGVKGTEGRQVQRDTGKGTRCLQAIYVKGSWRPLKNAKEGLRWPGSGGQQS